MLNVFSEIFSEKAAERERGPYGEAMERFHYVEAEAIPHARAIFESLGIGATVPASQEVREHANLLRNAAEITPVAPAIEPDFSTERLTSAEQPERERLAPAAVAADDQQIQMMEDALAQLERLQGEAGPTLRVDL